MQIELALLTVVRKGHAYLPANIAPESAFLVGWARSQSQHAYVSKRIRRILPFRAVHRDLKDAEKSNERFKIKICTAQFVQIQQWAARMAFSGEEQTVVR